MDIDQKQLDGLVMNPSESLNVEVKRWLDPSDPKDQAKIVIGCIALRNRNGGFFVIGFDDTTMQPDSAGAPQNPRTTFHIDIIQGLISRYTDEKFEVAVGFSNRGGVEFPVIFVPEGVRVPVATSKPLNGPDGKEWVKAHTVYFRTLNSNHTASSSPALAKDWKDIVEICFENREADIGRFLRRHLGSIDLKSLLGMYAGTESNDALDDGVAQLTRRAIALLAEGRDRFALAVENGNFNEVDKARIQGLASGLTWEVAVVVPPRSVSRSLDKQYLSDLLISNPRYTGWPVWLDARVSADVQHRPKMYSDAFEALIETKDMPWVHLDFWRLGVERFYLRRALQDDLNPNVTKGTVIDPILVIIRVAEAIAVALKMAWAVNDEMGTEDQLAFAFKWTNLKGRRLNAWANPMYDVLGSPVCNEEEVITQVQVPVVTPANALAPFVKQATEELFRLFDGTRIPDNVYENFTKAVLERKL